MKTFFQKTITPSKIWNTLKLIIAISLVGFVISKTNITQLHLLKNRMDWEWATLSFVLFLCMLLIKAAQYQVLMGRKTPYWSVLNIVIWQNIISSFMASSAGIASYMAMLKAEQGVKLSKSGIVFIITKIGDIIVIFFYLILSSSLVWGNITPLRSIVSLLSAGIFLGLVGFTGIVFWRKKFVTNIEYILRGIGVEQYQIAKRTIGTLHSLAEYNQKKILIMLRTGVGLSSAYITISMAFAYFNFKLFAVQIDFWPLIYVSSLMQLVSFIPIQVLGGLGVSEVTSVYLYSIFGLPEDEMIPVMLGLRALFYLMNIATLLYLPFYSLTQRNKELQNEV
ncbi:MAG: flippase-like domain-containing protein [Candidatus Jacksonbacteria bacterium]|jgi:uncharacterized membrane protein YbhN (UPF0104 family)|nr:flippase-like domain-containing protein [Candidatus Jacksonbacteria bacterium]MBT6062947.1 flippase-like domain-containing protein [Anaerolineae bacterium]